MSKSVRSASGWSVVLALALAGVVSPASAQPRAAGLETAPAVFDPLADLMGDVPKECGTVVGVAGLAELRGTPVGASTFAMLSDLGVLGASRAAWNAFAGRLGVGPERAVDDLLGELAVFADEGDGAHMGVITTIAPTMEEKLAGAFRPAPRRVEGGVTVLNIENGAFELAMGSQDEEGRARRVLLGSGATLFGTMLPMVGGGAPGGRWRHESAWSLVDLSRRASVRVVMRERGGDGGDRLFTLQMRATGNGWTGTFAGSRVPIVGFEPGGVSGPVDVPGDLVEHLAKDAVVCVASNQVAEGASDPSGPTRRSAGLFQGALRPLPLPSEVAGMPTGPGVVALAPMPGGDVAIVGALAVDRARAFGLGLDRAFTKEGRAPNADPAVTRAIVLRAGRPLGFAGMVSRRGDATLAWRLVVPGEGESGWWVFRIEPGRDASGADAALDVVVAALSKAAAEGPGARSALRTRVVIRPAELIAVMGRAGRADASGALRAFRHLGLIDASVRSDRWEDGAVRRPILRGEFRAEMNLSVAEEGAPKADGGGK